jgi:probable phosphoglycerate mutase
MIRHILLIRHGCTKMNSQAGHSSDKIRGWIDVPLNEVGRGQARKAGEELKGAKLDMLVSSDLGRAKETATIISKISGIPLELVTKAFRPWDVGKYAGTESDKSVPILADFAEHQPNKKIPEGEAFNTFTKRVFVGLSGLLHSAEGTIVIVTHHRVERLLEGWKAAGYPASGEIDIKVFSEKGEDPGHFRPFAVPLERLPKDVFAGYGWS